MILNTEAHRHREKKFFTPCLCASVLKKACLVFSILLLIVPEVFAALTIYFKDGTSREVHKITFRGNFAEMYGTDGNVVTVPVDKIDLPSSGIGAPVGTYGTSKVTGQRSLSSKKEVLGSPLKQARLREEWDSAERTATVTSPIGSMQKGDTVKVVGETNRSSRPRPEEYFDNHDLLYNPATNTYEFREKDLDHAFVVIYKNADGTYGKRLLDAVTFSSHFKFGEKPKGPAPMPEYPIIPDEKDPDVRETNPLAAPKKSREPAENAVPLPGEAAVAQEVGEGNETEELTASSRRRSWIAYAAFVFVVAGLGFGAWFLISRNQKPFLDTSKFGRYEEDLREFEIAIWLKNGKTSDQLMEICLKKFYQDHPSALAICNRMLKAAPRGATVTFIAKQSGRSMPEAERIYDQLQQQTDRIRNLIQEVSRRTGIHPAKPSIDPVPKPVASAESPRAAAIAPAPAPPPLPKPASSAAIPAPASVAMNAAPAEAASNAHLIEPDQPMRSASDLPQYASSVLNQISFLSSSEDK